MIMNSNAETIQLKISVDSFFFSGELFTQMLRLIIIHGNHLFRMNILNLC